SEHGSRLGHAGNDVTLRLLAKLTTKRFRDLREATQALEALEAVLIGERRLSSRAHPVLGDASLARLAPRDSILSLPGSVGDLMVTPPEETAASSGDLGRLETRQWEQLQDMASRFEASWQHAENADLAAFLPPPGNPLRRVALLELIKTDLEARWRRNQIIGMEAYLEKFPELGAAADLEPLLIYEEYRVRHRYGDKPALAGYERRFPHQFP